MHVEQVTGVLAFSGSCPQPLFDIVVGMHRWALWVAGYAALMIGRYPPFRFDLGSEEPVASAYVAQ